MAAAVVPRAVHRIRRGGRISRDDRYERPDAYWGFIADMWRMLGSLVAKDGHVVIRMGGQRNPTR